MISFIVAKVKNFVQKYFTSTRDVEYFLSKSVDRADFECREKQLKYKGIL